MLALLRDPDQVVRALHADPDLNAVPWRSSCHTTANQPRHVPHTTEAVEISGTTTPAGEVVLVALTPPTATSRGSGGRPLDLRRDEGSHLAFGFGLHHCLGARWPRLEGDIAFRTLLTRFPTWRWQAPRGADLARQHPDPGVDAAAGAAARLIRFPREPWPVGR